MEKRLYKHFDVSYFIRFVLILLTFYFFNVLCIGIVTPNGFYSLFADKYLNYPIWLIHIILFFSNTITHIIGLNSYVSNISLKVYQGSSVNMYWPCIGLQIMSFWLAFVLAHHGKWRNKLYWCLSGIGGIIIINSFRIALLLTAMQKEWIEISYVNHHTMFTWVSYFFIILMTYIYHNMNSPRKELRWHVAKHRS